MSSYAFRGLREASWRSRAFESAWSWTTSDEVCTNTAPVKPRAFLAFACSTAFENLANSSRCSNPQSSAMRAMRSLPR